MGGWKLCSALGIRAASLTGRAGATLGITVPNLPPGLPPPLTCRGEHYVPSAAHAAPTRQWATGHTEP